MQKVLGQDINDLDARKQFLLDNADEVVEMSYFFLMISTSLRMQCLVEKRQ